MKYVLILLPSLLLANWSSFNSVGMAYLVIYLGIALGLILTVLIPLLFIRWFFFAKASRFENTRINTQTSLTRVIKIYFIFTLLSLVVLGLSFFMNIYPYYFIYSLNIWIAIIWVFISAPYKNLFLTLSFIIVVLQILINFIDIIRFTDIHIHNELLEIAYIGMNTLVRYGNELQINTLIFIVSLPLFLMSIISQSHDKVLNKHLYILLVSAIFGQLLFIAMQTFVESQYIDNLFYRGVHLTFLYSIEFSFAFIFWKSLQNGDDVKQH